MISPQQNERTLFFSPYDRSGFFFWGGGGVGVNLGEMVWQYEIRMMNMELCIMIDDLCLLLTKLMLLVCDHS